MDKDKLKNIVKNGWGWMFTALIVVALVVYLFVSISFREKLDKDFWTSLCVNLGLMILLTSIWFPNGKLKAKSCNQQYISARQNYSMLMDKISGDKKLANIDKFCEYATEQNRLAKIKQKLIKMNVDFQIYQACLHDHNLAFSQKNLTDKQKQRLFNLLTNGVKVKKINPSVVKTGFANNQKPYDVRSDETTYDTFMLISKLLTSTVGAIFLAYLIFGDGGFAVGKLAQLLTYIILMAFNIITSYNAGYNSIASHRTRFYLKLKVFLEEFMASSIYAEHVDIVTLLPDLPETEEENPNSSNKGNSIDEPEIVL